MAASVAVLRIRYIDINEIPDPHPGAGPRPRTGFYRVPASALEKNTRKYRKRTLLAGRGGGLSP